MLGSHNLARFLDARVRYKNQVLLYPSNNQIEKEKGENKTIQLWKEKLKGNLNDFMRGKDFLDKIQIAEIIRD